MESWQADPLVVEAIVTGQDSDPFAVLGLQQIDGIWVLRAFIPHANGVSAFTRDGASLGELERRDGRGFFEGRVEITGRQPIRYHARNRGGDDTANEGTRISPRRGGAT